VFHDRAETGRQLADKLALYKGFALPRGGVPIGEPIAGTARSGAGAKNRSASRT
jgi:predicted phosphoribosyltransferase